MEIKSIDILDFKITLQKWIREQPFPVELKRMLVNEVLLELNQEAYSEIQQQAIDREKEEQEVRSDAESV